MKLFLGSSSLSNFRLKQFQKQVAKVDAKVNLVSAN
jgi:hypothetical protein